MRRAAIAITLRRVALIWWLVLLPAVSHAAAACDPCSASGCSGYDFRYQVAEYITSGSLGSYFFSFCRDTIECGPDSWSVGQVCLRSTASWRLLDEANAAAGLLLSLQGGDDFLLGCHAATSNVTVRCSSSSDALSVVTEGTQGNCSWLLALNSSAACLPPSPADDDDDDPELSHILLMTAVAVIVVFILIIAVSWCAKRRRSSSREQEGHPDVNALLPSEAPNVYFIQQSLQTPLVRDVERS
jgi:hypothetical protein